MFQLEIVTPDKLFYSGEAEMVVARGLEGDFAILKNRTPITAPLKIGRIRVFKDGEEREACVVEGYISFLDNKATIVTDAAEWEDEVDIDRAKAAAARAKKRLEERHEGIDVDRAEIALKRALNRLGRL